MMGMTFDDLSWRWYHSQWCPEDEVYVIDTKEARKALTTDEVINARLADETVDFIIISKRQLSTELQLTALNKYLKDKEERLAQHSRRES
jgi:hypothetical protein